MIRFGPAGWSYKDWQGVVYPEDPPKGFDPLAFLARYFDTIEVNSTFYRPPRPEVTPRWARRVAENPDFKFTAKLWQRFTHERDSAPSADEVAAVRAGLDPLVDRGRLGGLLIQFPWSFKAGDESLDWLDDVTSTFSDYPCVVEVRHASWNKPTFYRWLGERGVGFVNIDQPLFHRSIGPSAEASGCVGYVRLHGRNYDDWFREGAGRDARYDYLYGRDELEPSLQKAAWSKMSTWSPTTTSAARRRPTPSCWPVCSGERSNGRPRPWSMPSRMRCLGSPSPTPALKPGYSDTHSLNRVARGPG